MADFLEMFGAPLVACVLMGSILSHLGTHVLRREVIFIDIAVAQVAAVGALAAHMLFDVEEEALLFVSVLTGLRAGHGRILCRGPLETTQHIH